MHAANFVIPALNDNGAAPENPNDVNAPIHHLRFSNPACIGRDLYHGCPAIFHPFALHSIQATEILYSHHHSPRVDILMIKVAFDIATQEFNTDFHNNFPGFQFDTPMLFRRHFKLHERNDIFRNTDDQFLSNYTYSRPIT